MKPAVEESRTNDQVKHIPTHSGAELVCGPGLGVGADIGCGLENGFDPTFPKDPSSEEGVAF